MRHGIGSALFQIMACRLLRAKPLSEPMLGYSQLDILRNKLQWNFNQNTKLFIHANASESNTCEMTAILSRWVNPGSDYTHTTQALLPDTQPLRQSFSFLERAYIQPKDMHVYSVQHNVCYVEPNFLRQQRRTPEHLTWQNDMDTFYNSNKIFYRHYIKWNIGWPVQPMRNTSMETVAAYTVYFRYFTVSFIKKTKKTNIVTRSYQDDLVCPRPAKIGSVL